VTETITVTNTSLSYKCNCWEVAASGSV